MPNPFLGDREYGSIGLRVIAWLAVVVIAASACGPSQEEMDHRIDERVQGILANLATPTPILFPTPLPTSTPVPTVTPQPEPTIVAFPPTPTPMVLPPTPTPVTFPPTPTPIFLPPTPTPPAIVDFSAAYRRVWPSVFLIETSASIGSGWLIEPGLIITNQHVIDGASTVRVRQAANPTFSAAVLATDARRDIALLRFDPTRVQLNSRAAPLALGTISRNNIAETLMALGYSASTIQRNGTVGSAAANVGVLSQIDDFGRNGLGLNLVLDAPLDPGDSGGPVFDAEGLVVGMTRARMERNSNGRPVVGTYYAVHADEIRAALPALKRGQSR